MFPRPQENHESEATEVGELAATAHCLSAAAQLESERTAPAVEAQLFTGFSSVGRAAVRPALADGHARWCRLTTAQAFCDKEGCCRYPSSPLPDPKSKCIELCIEICFEHFIIYRIVCEAIFYTDLCEDGSFSSYCCAI